MTVTSYATHWSTRFSSTPCSSSFSRWTWSANCSWFSSWSWSTLITLFVIFTIQIEGCIISITYSCSPRSRGTSNSCSTRFTLSQYISTESSVLQLIGYQRTAGPGIPGGPSGPMSPSFPSAPFAPGGPGSPALP